MINKKIFENISILAKKKYEKFHKKNKSIVVLYSLTFLFIIIDVTSLLLAFNVGGISLQEEHNQTLTEEEKSNSWIITVPLLLEWIITLGFYINLKRRKYIIKSKIKKLISSRKNSIKCYTKERGAKFKKTLKLQEKNFSHSYFEHFLFSTLLYLLPLLIKFNILKNLEFKIVFCIFAILLYGYDIIFDVIQFIFIMNKRRKYNKELINENKNNLYKSINVIVDNNKQNLNEDNNISLGDIEINITNINENSIYDRNKKMKSIWGGIPMDISYLVVKISLELLFIRYLSRIGEKLDDPNNSLSWTLLFTPFYICFLPVLLFCILHILSLQKIFKDKIWIPTISVFSCFLTFAINCIIIPLKLDKKISLNNAFIPIFFGIGTIFYIIHLIILRKFKNSER